MTVDEGQGILEQAVSAFRSALKDRLVCVVLFGSRARREASLGSDWDLLVIATDLPHTALKRHLFLTRMLPPGPCDAISIIARTPSEFEASIPSLYLDIALDGQICFDPHGYAAQKLATLRRIIREQGLYRERGDAGDVWLWLEEAGT